MPLIRTTIRPDQEVEVSDQELLDLRRRGLVASDESDTDKAPAKGSAKNKGE